MAEIKEKLSKFESMLYSLVDERCNDSFFTKYFNQLIMLLIVLSVVAMALETVESLNKEYKYWFEAFEYFTILVFSFEYVVRLLTADLYYRDDPTVKTRAQAMWKYATSFYGLVDIITISPFYMPMIGLDLRFIRTLRLLRFLRLFKIARYNKSLTVIKDVMLDKRAEIGVSCFVIIIVMVIASFMMFFVEHEAQPEQFPNVFACIWWAIVTLTTVGYGDVFPITVGGRAVGGLIAFLGIGLVALPTGIISAGFLERISKKESGDAGNAADPISNAGTPKGIESATKNNAADPAIDAAKPESINAADPAIDAGYPADIESARCEKHTKLSQQQRLKIYNGAKHFCPYCGGQLDDEQ